MYICFLVAINLTWFKPINKYHYYLKRAMQLRPDL